MLFAFVTYVEIVVRISYHIQIFAHVLLYISHLEWRSSPDSYSSLHDKPSDPLTAMSEYQTVCRLSNEVGE